VEQGRSTSARWRTGKPSRSGTHRPERRERISERTLASASAWKSMGRRAPPHAGIFAGADPLVPKRASHPDEPAHAGGVPRRSRGVGDARVRSTPGIAQGAGRRLADLRALRDPRGRGARSRRLLRRDETFQVYGGVEKEHRRSSQAVLETRGEVLTYRGKLFRAYFHSTCGGPRGMPGRSSMSPPSSPSAAGPALPARVPSSPDGRSGSRRGMWRAPSAPGRPYGA